VKRDVLDFFKRNPQVLLLLVICVVLGVGTFLAVVFGIIEAGNTTTTGEPSDSIAPVLHVAAAFWHA
jgi:hypothetical protein